ncbi:hypothetical protein [Halorussus amylolyticus]|uniref:hypothetical protein n=1 Tax=Halorussus amylolyticus TaxID=1126242 RepID=UPI001EE40C78|nr:hypothetical protein [Halorussus amylolyticus]
MLNRDFEIQNTVPPMLQRRGGGFYVMDDGHHRGIVARAIGLDELYVDYEVVPPELIMSDNRVYPNDQWIQIRGENSVVSLQ